MAFFPGSAAARQTNTLPTVSLTAPAAGTYPFGPGIVVRANAADIDGTVVRVRFLADGTLIAADTTAPYSVTWNPTTAGSYSLTAVAIDNATGRTTSASRIVTLSAGGALPSGWTSQDIGSPPAAGSASFSGGAYTVNGAGNIWDTSDAFHFVHRQVTGDVDVVARVASLQNVDEWTRSGVMIRETLTGPSVNVTMMVTSAKGLSFQRRVATNGTTVSTLNSGLAPAWVKLARRGNTLTASRSADGTTWTTVGTQTLTLPATVYVGLVMTSDHATAAATGVVDSVTVGLGSPAPNTPPTVSLTAPLNGTGYTAPATIILTATASDSDVNGTVSMVEFYRDGILIGSDSTNSYDATWSSVPVGTYVLTAIARDNTGATTTSASRTVTVGSATNTPPTVALSAPANSSTHPAGTAVTVSATAADSNGTVAQVQFFANGTPIGTADTTTPYSRPWTPTTAGSYTLTAVATDNAAATTTSAAHTVTVTSTNTPPTVTLTLPANNSTHPAGTAVTVSATAADSNGTVAQVQFFANGTPIGTADTTTPYSRPWTPTTAGSYTLTAVATDNAGATTSAARSVIVTSPNTPPTVSLTAPSIGATYMAPASIQIDATAGDADGLVTVVEFYRDSTTLVGSDTTNAYTVTWSDVPAGTYALTAVARDSGGATTVSGSRTVVVNDPNTPGRAVFVPSVNHNTAVNQYVLEIFPAGADPIAANPVASQDLGKPAVVGGECEANILQTITNLPAGNYIATVTAFGPGGSAQSAASAPFTR